ncbi:MAG: OmpA family protein [Myxococcales bacterium]|nr:OmpA family protein [Myxococcales bacterium]
MLVLASFAHAAGYSLDVEMARTGFSLAPPGLDAPEVQKRGHVRAGILVQYELNPLVLVVDDVEVGSVVANRFDIQLGASIDVSRKLAVRATLPMAANFGSGIDALAADGFGARDLSAGVRYEILANKLMALGAHADLLVPISTADSYFGEVSPRFVPGVSFAAKPGELRVAADVGLMLRGPVTTQQTLNAGQEFTAAVDVSYRLLKDLVTPHLFMLTRVGLTDSGAASFPLEVLGGAQVKVNKEWYVDVYGGRGLTAGYGATDARIIAGVTFNRMPRDEKLLDTGPVTVFDARVTDAELDKIIEEPDPEPEPVQKELAVVTQQEIVIRDPIQFVVGNERILAASQPTLDFVAKLMAENADIQGLIIEGHASGEGSFEYNYELSRKRSEVIFRELVESGVSPSRLSYRSWGEVLPVKEGDDAANRRVVFTIGRRLAPGEPNAGWDTAIKLPWNGEARSIPGPSLPPPPETTERKLEIDEEEGK